MRLLSETIEKIRPVDKTWLEKAAIRQLNLTKPPQSLGRLEEIANRLCAIQETLAPSIENRQIIVCAADHGVCAEGISPYPPEVTAQMVANFLNGGAAINALAKASNTALSIVDVGVKSEVPSGENAPHVLQKRRVADGTKNIAKGAAMTESEMFAALETGIELAKEARRNGATVLGLGEMGIGNTTSASAITSALTGLTPDETTGRGTGADDGMLAHKIEIVRRALEVNRPDADDALDVLRKVGGFEIACLTGICLGAAAAKIAVVSDGFIATAAVALACKICPNVAEYVFAAHLSPEKGHAALLELIGQTPLLDLQMRLGEGTGAALAMNIMAAAVAAFNEMATFAQANVTDKETT